jgi:hypothetical protein
MVVMSFIYQVQASSMLTAGNQVVRCFVVSNAMAFVLNLIEIRPVFLGVKDPQGQTDLSALRTVLRGNVDPPLAGVHFFPMRTNTCHAGHGVI